MTTFDKREEAFESKFAHDEGVKFRSAARRNRLLGQWAAGLLGKSGASADAYVRDVVDAGTGQAGDEDVFRRIRTDFDAAGVKESDHQIRRTMAEMMQTAVRQIRDTA